MKSDGRRFRPSIATTADRMDDGRVAVRSPAVGFWRNPPASGDFIGESTNIGEIEILGVLHQLIAPNGVRGFVVDRETCEQLPITSAKTPVGFGDILVIVDPRQAEETIGQNSVLADRRTQDDALVFRSPTSGRFYRCPAPGKPPFVNVGDEIGTGRTVCLIEVMKTFNRVTFGGNDLPERARITEIIPGDQTDLESGDVILRIEPADGTDS